MIQENYFDLLFNPRGIVIYGVNKAPYGGTFFLRLLVQMKFDKPIYCINPKLKGENLYGYTVYGSIHEISKEDPIDLAIIAIPARFTPGLMKELGEHDVKFAHIFTSGYSEVGNIELENQLLEAAKLHNVRVIGPNCVGIYSPSSKITFAPDSSDVAGNIAFVSQSGGLAIRLAKNGPSREYYFSKIVSLGNQIDINITELLEYFKNDSETKIIGLYIENIGPQGKKFLDLVRETTLKKPVVIWKAGISDTGKSAVMSHTGGLAGDYKIWQAMAKQSGAILVENFQELTETIQALSFYNIPETKDITILSAGGGNSIEATDDCERAGLNIPIIPRSVQEKIHEFIPKVNTNVQNPFDLGAVGLNNTSFGKVIRILKEDTSIRTVIFIRSPERFKAYEQVQKIPDFENDLIAHLTETQDKNLMLLSIPLLLDENEYTVKARYQYRKKLEQHKIMSFYSAVSAAKCVKRLWEYGNFLRKVENTKN
jgi:acyl-CoA synthetase (NDP forming)